MGFHFYPAFSRRDNFGRVVSEKQSVVKRFLRNSTSITTATIFLSFANIAHLSAQEVQVWDPDSSAGVQGGAGDWNGLDSNWTLNNGSSNIVYDGTGTPPPALQLDTSGGIVEVVGDKNVGNIFIESNGYEINGDRLIVGPGNSTLRVGDSNDTVVINSEFAGTGTITKEGSGGAVLNADNTNNGLFTILQGSVTNNGTIAGDVDNQANGVLNSNGTLGGDLTNAGKAFANGTINGDVTNNGGGVAGQFTVNGNLDIDGDFVNNSTSSNALTIEANSTLDAQTVTSTNGTVNNNGTLLAPVTLDGGTFNNNSGSALNGDLVVNGGVFDNAANASITGNVDNADGATGVFNSNGTITGNVESNNTQNLSGIVTGDLTFGGNNSTAIGNLTVGGVLENNSSNPNALIIGNGISLNATEVNNNAGTILNSGSIVGNVNNAGSGTFSVSPTGTIVGDVDNAAGGTFNLNNAVLTGDFTNSATANLSGEITGDLTSTTTTNVVGTLDVVGTTTSDLDIGLNGQFTAQSGVNGNINVQGDGTNGGILNLQGPLVGSLNNAGFANISDTITGDVTNNGGGATGQITLLDDVVIAGDFVNNSTNVDALNVGPDQNLTAGTFTSTAGIVNNDGTINAPVTLTGGDFNVSADGAINGDTVITGGEFINAGTIDNVDNQSGGTFTNAAGSTAGQVTNAGAGENDGQIASLTNTNGSFGNTGAITGNVVNSGGTTTNTGSIAGNVDVTNGNFDQNTGGSVAGFTSISESAVATNSGQLAGVNNQGLFTNEASGTAENVENSGIATNIGDVASVNNTDGIFDNDGNIAGDVVLSGGGIENSSTIGGEVNASGGVFENNGAIAGDVNVTGGTFDQNVGGVISGTTTISGTARVANGGTMQNVINQEGGTFINEVGATMEDFTNSGIAQNNGIMNGEFTNLGGIFVNGSAGDGANSGFQIEQIVGSVDPEAGEISETAGDGTGENPGGSGQASGTINVVTNSAGAGFHNSENSKIEVFNNAGIGSNDGTIETLSNTAGSFTNNSEITGNVNLTGGDIQNKGMIGGTLDVSTGSFEQAPEGVVAGQTTVSGTGNLKNEGTLADVDLRGGTISNSGQIKGDLDLSGGVFTQTNTGTVDGSTDISGDAVLNNAGTLAGGVDVQTGGTLNSTGTIEGGLTNAGTANLEGVVSGPIVNNTDGVMALTGTLNVNDAFTNHGTFDASGGSLNGVTVFNNSGTLNIEGLVNINAAQFNSLEGNLVNLINDTPNEVFNVSGNSTIGGSVGIDIDSVNQNSDQIQIGGSVTLQDTATLNVNLLKGGATSQTTFLTAAGGVTDNGISIGTITGLINPLAQTSIVQPDANSLAFRININATQSAFNRNQSSLLGHINNGGSDAALNQLIGLASQEATANSLDQLDGEIFLTSHASALASAESLSNKLHSCNSGGKASLQNGDGECAWLAASLGSGERERTSENLGVDRSYSGIAIGGQRTIRENWQAGVALGLQRGDTTNDVNHRAETREFHAGVVVKHRRGPWDLSGSLAAGSTDAKTTRRITLGNAAVSNTASQDVSWYGSQLRASYMQQRSDGVYIEPSASLNITRLQQDGFAEKGNDGTVLTVNGSSKTYVSISPSIEAGKDFVFGDNTQAKAYVRAGATLQNRGEHTLSARFTNAPAAISGFNNELSMDRAAAKFGTGIVVVKDEKFNFEAGYEGQFSSNERNHSGFLRGVFKF